LYIIFDATIPHTPHRTPLMWLNAFDNMLMCRPVYFIF